MKKELTTKQEANKHWITSKLLTVSKPLATITPLGITMIVEKDNWFNQDWKISTGGTIAIIVMGVVSLLVNKKTEDKTITNTWITLIVGLLTASFIAFLFSQIAYEIWWILLVAVSGCAAGAGIDYFEKDQMKKYNQKMMAYNKARENVDAAKAEQEIKEEDEMKGRSI